MVFALPAIPAAAGGLAVILVLFALAIMLIKPLIVIFRAIPFIGEQLGNALAGAAGKLGEITAGLLDAELQAATNVLDWLSGNITSAARWLTSAAAWLGTTLGHILSALVGQAIMLGGQVRGLLASVAHIAAQLASALPRLAAVAAAVGRILTVTIPAAVAAGVNLAVARALAVLNTVRLGLVGAIATALAAALRAVGAEAAARIAQDIANRSWAAAQVAAAATIAARELGELRREVGADVSSLGRAIEGVDARIGAIAAPTVAIAIGTLVTELTTLRRNCIDPTCGFLGPQLDALNALEDIALLAAITAMVANAAHNPEGAARDTISEGGALIGGAAGLFAEMTGVRA